VGLDCNRTVMYHLRATSEWILKKEVVVDNSYQSLDLTNHCSEIRGSAKTSTLLINRGGQRQGTRRI